MKTKKTLNAGTNPGDSLLMCDLGMSDEGVACFAYEQSTNQTYRLKVLKKQLLSDLEFLTIQMRSTRHRSDDPFHDCL